MGLPAFVIDAVMSIQDMWQRRGFDITSGDIEHLTCHRPRSLEDVLRAALK